MNKIYICILLIGTILQIQSSNNSQIDFNNKRTHIINALNGQQRQAIEEGKKVFDIPDNDFEEIKIQIIKNNTEINKLFLDRELKNFHFYPLSWKFVKKVGDIVKSSGIVPHTLRICVDNTIKKLAKSNIIFYNNYHMPCITFNVYLLTNKSKELNLSFDMLLASVVKHELSHIAWSHQGSTKILADYLCQKKGYTEDSIAETPWYKDNYVLWKEIIADCYPDMLCSASAFNNLIIRLSNFQYKNDLSDKIDLYQTMHHMHYCENLWQMNVKNTLQIFYPSLVKVYEYIKNIKDTMLLPETFV